MITLLDGFPENTIAASCSGRVTAQDYETVLTPAVESALAKHPKLRLFYQIEPAFSGLEPGAMWDDLKLGMSHFSRWERVALVTDVEWIRLAAEAFGFLMPGQIRAFTMANAAKARHWVVSSPTGAGMSSAADLARSLHEARLEEMEFDALVIEELQRRRADIIGDTKRLFRKYQAIFDGEVPEIGQPLANALILREMREALRQLEGDSAA